MKFENFLREYEHKLFQVDEMARKDFEHLPYEERVDILATFLIDGLTALLSAGRKIYGKLDMDVLSKNE